MKKILAALIALFPFWGFSAENQPDARPAGASAPGSRPVPVRIRQIGQKPAAEADKAVVTLTVEYNWGDGAGYQLLLDADATAFGTLFPSDANVGYWNESGGIADSVYAGFEYKIPADASGDLDAGRFVLAGESVSVAIDPGTYDFVVPCMMPFYYCVAFSSYGQNRGDDFAFEAGMEYVFEVLEAEDFLDETIFRTVPPVNLAVNAIPSPVNGLELEQEEVVAEIGNVGTKAVDAYSLTLTVDGKAVATETVEGRLEPGGTYLHAFAEKADLSAPGVHTVQVEVLLAEDTVLENNVLAKTVYHAEAVEAPFFCDFDTEEDMAGWVSLDENGDGIQWYRNEGFDYGESGEGAAAFISYNNAMPLDDYLLTLNPVSLKAGKNHVAFYFRSSAASVFTENLRLLYGPTADVDAMEVLWEEEGFAHDAFRFQSVEFELEEDGPCYFAFQAFSEPGMMGIQVDNVLIGTGAYTGIPDLRVDRLLLPVSSCGLGQAEPVGVAVSNVGTMDVSRLVLECELDGTPFASDTLEMLVPQGESREVWFEKAFDFSREGEYGLSVTVKVCPQGDEVAEQVTDNNDGRGKVVHYEPVRLLRTDFTDAASRTDWTCTEGAWTYDEAYRAVAAKDSMPLISRCVEMEEGKDYRFSMNYLAGGYVSTIAVVDDFDLRYGLSGTPVEEWDTLACYRYHSTHESFRLLDTTFSVPVSGEYSFAIVPRTLHGTFFVNRVEISEQLAYDVRLEAFGGFASRIPADQAAASRKAWFSVSDRGTEPVDTVLLSILMDGEEIARGAVAMSGNGNATVAALDFSLGSLDPGLTKTLTARVAAKGHEQEDTNEDNEAVALVMLTDSVLAYDRVDTSMYENPAYQLNGRGLAAGMVFDVPVADTLTAISVGWTSAFTDQTIGLYVYHWDRESASLGSLIHGMSVSKGLASGQTEYPLPALLLSPGSYMIAVSFSGYALVSDMQPLDAIYLISDGQAYLQTGGLGYAAIRGVFGTGTPVAKDVMVESFLSPGESGLFSANEEVRIKVRNLGYETVSFPLSLHVDENVSTQTVELDGYGSGEVVFTADLSRTETVYSLRAVAALDGDENPGNDTLEMQVRTYGPADPYHLDFEYCSDFAVDSFNPAWTSVDGDGLPSGGWEGTTYPHEGESFGFMAFNPALTVPPLTETAGDYIAPHGGQRFGISIYSSDGANNDWLISPELLLPAQDAKMEFYVKSYMEADGLEQYKVLVSEKTAATGDFVEIGGVREAPADAWEHVEVDLSAYAGKKVHLAIQCVSDNVFAFMIDDISVSRPGSSNEQGLSADAEVVLYPNPASERLAVRSYGAAIDQVSIYDLQGRLVYRSAQGLGVEEFRYDVEGMKSGLYIVETRTDRGVSVSRLIVR